MSEVYTTTQGDTFESIAWFRLGDSNLMVNLIRENREYMDIAEFEAGVILKLPEADSMEATTESSTNPPWR